MSLGFAIIGANIEEYEIRHKKVLETAQRNSGDAAVYFDTHSKSRGLGCAQSPPTPAGFARGDQNLGGGIWPQV